MKINYAIFDKEGHKLASCQVEGLYTVINVRPGLLDVSQFSEAARIERDNFLQAAYVLGLPAAAGLRDSEV